VDAAVADAKEGVNMRAFKLKAVHSLAVAALVCLLQNSSASAARQEGPAEFFNRLAKMGIPVPAWFFMPGTPPSPGDLRPSTPLENTASTLLLLDIGSDGKVSKCQMLLSNGTEAEPGAVCRIQTEKTWAAAPAAYQKAFWFHAYADPATQETKFEVSADIPLKQPQGKR
jgi:hypothetical protein